MKKLCLVIVVIIGTIYTTNAQDENVQNSNTLDIKIGAKAGLNFATITGDVPNIKGRTSFHLGGMAEITVSDQFSVQPELLFSSQGAKYGDATLVLNYLYVPVMAKYYVTDKLSLEVGPQFGYLLSAKLKENSTEDVKDDIKSFDLGFNLGLGYKLDNGFNFSARYNFGLLDGNNFDNSFGKFKNGAFQISVGYFFL